MRYEIDGQRLTDIADAIRDQTGGSATIAPENMPTQIRSISGGGDLPSGGSEGQVLTIVSGEPDWADVPTELPDGGTSGQVLTKTNNGAAWYNVPSELPGGGNDGQVLTKSSNTVIWADAPEGLPSGGNSGQVLTKTSSGVEWQTPSSGDNLPSDYTDGYVLACDGDYGSLKWSPGVPAGSSDDYGKALFFNESSGGPSWQNVFPDGGSEGGVLGLNSGDLVWIPRSDIIPTNGSYGALLFSDGDGGSFWAVTPMLPSVNQFDEGKVLMVNSTGEWVAANLPT